MRHSSNAYAGDALLLAFLLLVFVGAWLSHPAYQPSGFAVAPADEPVVAAADTVPFFERHFASSDIDDYVHSPSIAPLSNGDLMAVWFSGSREGAKDVQIRLARYLAATQEWSNEIALATREQTTVGVNRYIRKLGNPVLAAAPNGRLWLFYVSVSVGGWAGSAINVMTSDDQGVSWTQPRRLITSPFFNISTLVRSAPVFHADGSIGLPVYHEFLGKFAEYLYLDADGRVLDKFRISKGRYTLQPSVVPISESSAVALLRYAGTLPGKVLVSRTDDAGRTWSEPRPLSAWNPNSSLAATRTPDNQLLVALNDLQMGRFRLSLFEVDSGLSDWRPLIELEQAPNADGAPMSHANFLEAVKNKLLSVNDSRHPSLLDKLIQHLDSDKCKAKGCEFEFEYPYFVRAPDGRFHLVYAWNNNLIKHVTFNNAWRKLRE